MTLKSALCFVVLWSVCKANAAAAASTAKQKPNFIVIITDDQGWDDIGLHNPQYINTPNFDKFIKHSTFFDNFYVTPQCAQTRAALLTGRSYPRTGTVLVNGGYDFISSDDATAGKVMSQAGYTTLQYGKWHNLQVLGYEPWHVGFDSGQSDSPVAGLVSSNGTYEELADNDGEGQRMGQLVSYLSAWKAAKVKAASKHGTKTAYSGAQPGDIKPFFVYYATPAIHVHRDKSELDAVKKVRQYPDSYRDKYHHNATYQGISNDTLDAWATLEYFDVQLGRLMDYLKTASLDRDTFVMIMSDNGAALMQSEDKHVNMIVNGVRMPSGMVGNKSSVLEGGVRNFLAVQGPGVQPGVIDSTLLDVTDVLPTLAELADVGPGQLHHKPWDGISFKNLLLPKIADRSSSSSSSANATSKAGSPAQHSQQPPFVNQSSAEAVQAESQPWLPIFRGRSAAKRSQVERFLVILGPQCWDPNAVLTLDNATREPIRPQNLLDYRLGGVRNSIHSKETPWLAANQTGFEPCMAVRYKDYKWIGATGKVYRFPLGSHLELPSAEVPKDEAPALAALLSSAAQKWWESVIAEPSSFAKPLFYLGLNNWTATNVLAAGAHERTGSITLLALGAKGFVNAGERMCFKVQVLTAGLYEVIPMYTSNIPAMFKLSVGPFHSIQAGTVPSVTSQLPPLSKIQGISMGALNLPVTPPGTNTEACLELIASSKPGVQVFRTLANLRFIRRTDTHSVADAITGPGGLSRPVQTAPKQPAAPSVTRTAPSKPPGPAGNSSSPPKQPSQLAQLVHAKPNNMRLSRPTMQQQWQNHADAAVPPGGPQSDASSHPPKGASWQAMQRKYLLVEGQGVFESVFSPYNTEELEKCGECEAAL